MTREKGKMIRNAAEKLDQAVKKLRKIGRGPVWVCREVLSLGVDWKFDEVLTALHGKLHEHMGEGASVEATDRKTVAIYAAAVLLKTLLF